MTDINKWIDEQIAAGQDISDLAAIVSDLLNEKEKEIAAAREADRSRRAVLDNYFDTVVADLDTNNITYATAAAVAAIVWARKNGRASAQEIEKTRAGFEKMFSGEKHTPVKIEPKVITVNSAEDAFKAIETFLFNNRIK